ncbi:hypothetical protein Gotri_000760 [Gossypium trilobum]|uniref:Uncharacterized protein n=2 Tax=Gossypium trilobum TaxID=34281 RepID=A0A7J9FCS8_9ROSI|nr:hypothetical protein [Gossypium trilobum]
MATPPPPLLKIDLWTIRSEYCRIIKAHSRHFLALSLLFLLPCSFFLSIYPFIAIEFYLSFLQQDPSIIPTKTFILNLLYTLPISIFSLLATGSITYSIFHGFNGRPIKLLSAIKAAFTSFFPLFSTCLMTQLIVSGISLILGLAFSAVVILGFQVRYPSPYFIFLCLVYVIILLFVVVHLQVNWIFAYVVVVVESSWGFEPLKRSQNLVKGMKGVALKIILFFGFFISINTWRSVMTYGDSAADKWTSWLFVLNIFVTSTFSMVFMFYNLAANTVFYIYAKALHGELAEDEEFAAKYVSLAVDDGKAPHVVSIV